MANAIIDNQECRHLPSTPQSSPSRREWKGTLSGRRIAAGADLPIVRRRPELHPGIIDEQSPEFIPKITPQHEKAGQEDEVRRQVDIEPQRGVIREPLGLSLIHISEPTR